jgi:hypothetical protein
MAVDGGKIETLPEGDKRGVFGRGLEEGGEEGFEPVFSLWGL